MVSETYRIFTGSYLPLPSLLLWNLEVGVLLPVKVGGNNHGRVFSLFLDMKLLISEIKNRISKITNTKINNGWSLLKSFILKIGSIRVIVAKIPKQKALILPKK
jgi:hypothetical protein